MRIPAVLGVLATVVFTLLPTTAADAVPPTIPVTPEINATANCNGAVTVSANYVRHTGSRAALGAIQLCKFPRVIAGSTKWYAFGRIQMYSPLAAQQWANAWLYINTNGTYRTYTCDDHGSPQAHVTQGETTCWTPAYWVSGGQTFQATGRAYRSNGSSGWTLFADGATLACYLNGCI